jgi:hypothetical protein
MCTPFIIVYYTADLNTRAYKVPMAYTDRVNYYLNVLERDHTCLPVEWTKARRHMSDLHALMSAVECSLQGAEKKIKAARRQRVLGGDVAPECYTAHFVLRQDSARIPAHARDKYVALNARAKSVMHWFRIPLAGAVQSIEIDVMGSPTKLTFNAGEKPELAIIWLAKMGVADTAMLVNYLRDARKLAGLLSKCPLEYAAAFGAAVKGVKGVMGYADELANMRLRGSQRAQTQFYLSALMFLHHAGMLDPMSDLFDKVGLLDAMAVVRYA